MDGLSFHEKDSTQNRIEHQDLIDFSVLTDTDVSPIVSGVSSVGNVNHMSPATVSTLSSFHSTMDVLTESMSQNQHRTLPPLPASANEHLHQQRQHQDPIMTTQPQGSLHHHNSLSSHHNQITQMQPMQQQHQHQMMQANLANMSHELQVAQQAPQIMMEIVEMAVENEMQEPVQIHDIVTPLRTGTTEVPRPNLDLEQCCICSANYGKPRRIFPQPDINRLLSKLLDITPVQLANRASFFSQYIPFCVECAKKLKKYERLRNEMDVIRQDVVSSLTDSLLYIQPKVGSALASLKQPFLNRWVHRQADRQGSGTSQSLTASAKENNDTFKKPARVLPKHHYVNNKKVQPTSEINQMNLGPWQLAGEVNIFTTDSTGNIAEGPDGQQYVTAYLTEDGIISNEYHEEMVLNPKTGIFVTKRKRQISPDKQSQRVNSNGEVSVEDESKKKPKQSNVDRAKQHEKPPYFCESCGRVFSILKSLRSHASECATEPTKPTQCSICFADFSESTWLDLKFHIDLAHGDECQLEKCRHCRAEFLPNTIGDHECAFESSGNANAIKPHQEYKCDFCEKTYFHTNSLSIHVTRHHRGEQSFTCEICSRTFGTSAILKTHMTTHKTEPAAGKSGHKCDVCGIFCSTAWGLKQHKTIHSGERQYQCETCGKKFRLYQAWRTHEVVHTRERKYSCQICGKLFAMQSTMQRHVKRHINPLPTLQVREACPICRNEQSFIKFSALKRHMLLKHPGTQEQLKICSDRAKLKSGSNQNARDENEQEVNTNGDGDEDLATSGDDDEDQDCQDMFILKNEDQDCGDSDIEEILQIRNSDRSRTRKSVRRQKSVGGSPPASVSSKRLLLKRNSL